MQRRRLMGIDPAALEAALQEQAAQHQIAIDELRGRLEAAKSRLADLRARRQQLRGELNRLDGEVQALLQEMERAGQESDRSRQALLERHRQIEEALSEGIAILEQELDGWIDLERRIAEGVIAALQPYLDLTSLLPGDEAPPWPGRPHPEEAGEGDG